MEENLSQRKDLDGAGNTTLSFDLPYISLILIVHSLQQFFYDLHLYNLYFNVIYFNVFLLL